MKRAHSTWEFLKRFFKRKKKRTTQYVYNEATTFYLTFLLCSLCVTILCSNFFFVVFVFGLNLLFVACTCTCSGAYTHSKKALCFVFFFSVFSLDVLFRSQLQRILPYVNEYTLLCSQTQTNVYTYSAKEMRSSPRVAVFYTEFLWMVHFEMLKEEKKTKKRLLPQ